jgi:regulator of sigma E protease
MTVIYFLIAVFILVLVHEAGHFMVARAFGIKVHCFSIGFGRVLFAKKDKTGTEYTLRWLPLGGYVKMLDTREEDVAVSEWRYAFDKQSVYKRIAVVIAGPLVNLLFAVILFSIVGMVGMRVPSFMIGHIYPTSIASNAGLTSEDVVIAIENKPIYSLAEGITLLATYQGSAKTVQLRVKNKDALEKTVVLDVSHWHMNMNVDKSPFKSLGFELYTPTYPMIVGDVVPNSPADKSGIKKGDNILSVNQIQLSDWLIFSNFVKDHPNQSVLIRLKRSNKIKLITAVIGEKLNQGRAVGFLGLSSLTLSLPKDFIVMVKLSPVEAMIKAVQSTYFLSKTTFSLFYQMVTGQLSLDNVSGPVGIAKGAGDAGQAGLLYFLSFLGLLSISLGVINLLPLPMLDGGHILFYIIEILIRRPLPMAVMQLAQTGGLFVLLGLMVIAMKNDIIRLVG